MFDNVLVGVGSREAGRDALALARQLVSTNGALTLVRVQVVAQKPSATSGLVREAEERRRELNMLASLRDEARVDAKLASVKGLSVARGLHAVVRRERSDLLVVAASRAGDADRMLIGDANRDVLREARCVVAVAPVGYATCARPLNEVAVAYDGSPASERALELARQLAADARAKVIGFQAITDDVAVHDAWNPGAEVAAAVEHATRQIAALGDIEPVVRPGQLTEAVAQFEPSVDLLVLGAHEHGRLDRFLRVSTSETLAEHPTSPLLVLPPATGECP